MPHREWTHPNTDAMHLVLGVRQRERLQNVPVVGTRAQLPTDHVAELVDGFEEMYRFLMTHRDALLQADGPLATMNGQPMRFIFRPTMVYLRILEQALAPRYLRCGVDVSVELARVCRAFVGAAERPKAWPILAAELQALERLDVPHFTIGTEETSLRVGTGSPVEHYFRRSAYAECASRVIRMNDADLARQSDIIRGCVHARIADVHASDAAATPVEALHQPDERGRRRVAVCTTSALERAAQAIAEDIERRSLRISPDSIDWLGLSYFRRTSRMHVDLLGDSLFDGRCGVALFLAAYSPHHQSFHLPRFGVGGARSRAPASARRPAFGRAIQQGNGHWRCHRHWVRYLFAGHRWPAASRRDADGGRVSRRRATRK